jgi:hypothetical protein
MKELNNNLMVDSRAIDGATIIFGAIKALEGKINSNTINQITRNLRFMHDYWIVGVSKKSELIVNNFNLSFKNNTYRKSYVIAKKISNDVFVREHINGGTYFLSKYLIENYKTFKSSKEVLSWLIDNTCIIVRHSSEKNSIKQDSKLENIIDLIEL